MIRKLFHVVAIAGGIGFLGAVSRGQNLMITSLSGDGTLTWTSSISGIIEFRVQGASNLESGGWTNESVAIVPTGTVMSATVSMLPLATSHFYRLVAVTNPPAGMVWIPAGSNRGTNPLAVGESYDATSYPQTYALTVASFYMDKGVITKGKWDEVYNWAITNGYSFENAGSGMAANHPVRMVNWYDCVKWCNARSEMEGRPPAYYTSRMKSVVYRTGWASIYIFDNCVNWSGGYRLPTDTEWEYAARSGLISQRYPWGNTIDHSKANYYGDPATYTYDLGYAGFDDIFSGDGPYTSPIGYYAPNDFGLFDMTGNMNEWCGTMVFSIVYYDFVCSLRGGGWYDSADRCRVGIRGSSPPGMRNDIFGFRVVLPLGQ